MVEPTYVDIWNQNRLPKSVFVVGFTSLEDSNVGVNGLSLPNFWDIGPDGDSEKNINLSEKIRIGCLSLCLLRPLMISLLFSLKLLLSKTHGMKQG